MGCVSCRQRTRRINGLSVFKQRLQDRRTSDPKTVNSIAHNEYEPKIEHSVPITKPRITPHGWVVTCLVCGADGNPAQLPQMAKAKCQCKE